MPNRIIKESVCTSDSIDSLSWFEEVLFYRLIVNCDDFGRFDGRPIVIKNRLFPLKENLTTKAVTDALNKLASAELVALYEYEGKPYLYLPSWTVHQQTRATKSKYPSPVGNLKPSESTCKQMISDDINENQGISNAPVFVFENRESLYENREAENAHAREPVAAVVSAYAQKINPTPSTACLSELEGFVDALGAELCLKAIDIATDANARDWRYIKVILADWQRQGYKTAEDVDRAEAERRRKKNGGKEWDFRELAGNG